MVVFIAVLAACLIAALVVALVVLACCQCQDSEQAQFEAAAAAAGHIQGVVEEAKGEMADASDEYLRQVYEHTRRKP